MIEGFSTITPQGDSIARLFLLALVPSAIILAIVFGVLGVVLIRDRERPGDPEPAQVHGHQALEIAWTAVPFLLLVVFFWLTVQTMRTVEAAPAPAMRIEVIGHQWWWEFRYPDLGVVTANELHLPVDVPVQLELRADDVIHSFWVPRIGWKKDAIPGASNTMIVRVDEAGTFEGACAEYCGTQHAWMRIRVVAESQDELRAWAGGQQAPAPSPVPDDALANRGEQLFLTTTCVNCHTIAGTTAGGTVGPDLSHLGSRSTLGAGVAENTSGVLQQWIRDPHTLKPGVLMPAYGTFSADDLAALAAYLDGLK